MVYEELAGRTCTADANASKEDVAGTPLPGAHSGPGWVAEWFKAALMKTAEGASHPIVRISSHPPNTIDFIGIFILLKILLTIYFRKSGGRIGALCPHLAARAAPCDHADVN